MLGRICNAPTCSGYAKLMGQEGSPEVLPTVLKQRVGVRL